MKFLKEFLMFLIFKISFEISNYIKVKPIYILAEKSFQKWIKAFLLLCKLFDYLFNILNNNYFEIQEEFIKHLELIKYFYQNYQIV